MRVYPTATLAALESGAIIRRDLIALYLDSGTYGFARGMVGKLTWNSIDFIGSGSLIEIQSPETTMGLEAKSLTVRLRSGESEAADASVPATVLSTIFTEGYRRRKFIRWMATFDPDTYELTDPPEIDFEGYIESISLKTEEGISYLEGIAQSVNIDMTTRGWAMANDAHHQQVSSGDTFFKYSATAGTVAIYWGTEVPPNAKTGVVPL